MASSQLQQAVTLAQQGQRDEAARLLRQFVHANPDHEVAWLWLASVAGDQPEYVRALNEVLRINPSNARAHRLLDDFNQQFGPLSAVGAAPPVDRATPVLPVEPVSAPLSPPPSPMPMPPSPYGRPAYAAQPAPDEEWVYAPPGAPQPGPLPPSQVRYVTEREVIVKRRGCFPGCLPGCMLPGCILPGCGCWQGCLLAVLLLLVVPIFACGALSLTPGTLGPLDWPASYLPDRLGRKTIEMTHDEYTVELTVPRSWQVAEDQNEWWEFGREILTEAIPFASSGTSWYDFEAEVGKATTLLETDPVALSRGGSLISMTYKGLAPGEYACANVRSRAADYDEVTEYERNLCGGLTFSIDPWKGEKLRDIDPPDQLRTIDFYVPASDSTALHWQITLPEKLYGSYRGDINALIESVKITPPPAT